MLRKYPPLWTPKVVQEMFPRLTPYVLRSLRGLAGVTPVTINRKTHYTPEDIRRIYWLWYTGQRTSPFPWDKEGYKPISTIRVLSAEDVAEELGIDPRSVRERARRYNVGRKPFHSSRVFTPGDVDKLKKAIKTKGRDTPFRYDLFHRNIRSQALDDTIKTIHTKLSKGCYRKTPPRKERVMASKRPVTISTTISVEMDEWLDEKVKELAPVARKGGVVYAILEEAMRKERPIQEETKDESDR